MENDLEIQFLLWFLFSNEKFENLKFQIIEVWLSNELITTIVFYGMITMKKLKKN